MPHHEASAPDDFATVADAQSRALSRTVCLAGDALTVALWPRDLQDNLGQELTAMRLEMESLRPRMLDDDGVVPAGTRLSVALPTRSAG